MFTRVLIANRGEIALRILRTCKELGIETVAVYSKADAGSKYLDLADETVCIGEAPPADSYLNIPHLISAAEITNVDAIHPGYGFVAEKESFAEICEESNIVFIGPRSDVIRRMGDKAEARRTAQANKIPVIPGSEGVLKDDDQALELAHQIGYPVMVKAAAGGGGRGMRKAHNDISLKNMLAVARTEADAAFKNPAVYIEKVIEHARHIEVQILADQHGNIVHLGERDCSIQRRFQKLIEESPSPGITEEVTGVDLVKEQIRIAAGEKMMLQQKRLSPRGVAIECRINAENPADAFRTSPGTIQQFIPPGGPGVRLDTHVHSGYVVRPYYDSMIAKLIVHRRTRKETLACLRRALAEFVVDGIHTTIPFYRDLIQHAAYVSGKFNVHYVEELLETT